MSLHFEEGKSVEQSLSSAISEGVNRYCLNYQKFCEHMNGEHKTLQQSFTRLCFEWIRFCASDEYRTDGRNQATHDACKKIVENVSEDYLYLPFI